MRAATVVFLIKRKLLIKGIKAQKAAAAASLSPSKQLGARFYRELPRKARLPYLTVRIPYDLARHRATGHGDFQQDGAGTQP